MKIYGEVSDEELQETLDKIYHDTKCGDRGPITPDMIDYIIFTDEGYEWNSIQGPSFERIRRITGYLTGTLDRFNNAKRHEEKDRVKHSLEEK